MSTAQVRDLVLVRDRDSQQRLRDAEDVLKAWAAEWLSAEASWQPQLTVACSTESDLAGITPAWAHASDGAKARLAALMVGRERGQPLPDEDWAWQAAGTALAELHAGMLAKSWGLAHEEGGPDLRRLSGAIAVQELSLGLNWVWQRSPVAAPQAGQITPLADCLKTQYVQLTVGLGEVEIAVADLLALQIGDVIRFPALLKSPVPLSIGVDGCMKAAPISAQLGELNGQVAIKLSSEKRQ